MSGKDKKDNCPLCQVSDETINQLKGAKKKDELYKCSECGYWYKEKKWAKKCQTWCKKHKSCNLEITKHAASRPR